MRHRGPGRDGGVRGGAKNRGRPHGVAHGLQLKRGATGHRAAVGHPETVDRRRVRDEALALEKRQRGDDVRKVGVGREGRTHTPLLVDAVDGIQGEHAVARGHRVVGESAALGLAKPTVPAAARAVKQQDHADRVRRKITRKRDACVTVEICRRGLVPDRRGLVGRRQPRTFRRHRQQRARGGAVGEAGGIARPPIENLARRRPTRAHIDDSPRRKRPRPATAADRDHGGRTGTGDLDDGGCAERIPADGDIARHLETPGRAGTKRHRRGALPGDEGAVGHSPRIRRAGRGRDAGDECRGAHHGRERRGDRPGGRRRLGADETRETEGKGDSEQDRSGDDAHGKGCDAPHGGRVTRLP